MPCATDVRDRLAARAHRLQAALDHVHAIERLLDGDEEHEPLAHVARLGASLTVARDATAALARHHERAAAE